jgi:hypothetical protein
VTWTPFESSQELKAHVARALAQAMLDRGEQFGLRLDEAEPLLALGKTEEEEEKTVKPDRRRGAGRGGVILGRGA